MHALIGKSAFLARVVQTCLANGIDSFEKLVKVQNEELRALGLRQKDIVHLREYEVQKDFEDREKRDESDNRRPVWIDI